jgi:hypothetical protein
MNEKYHILLVNHTWFKNELVSLGHSVLTVGYRGGFDITFPWSITIQDLYSLLPSDFKPDRIVYFDDSSDPSILDIEQAGCPTIFLSIDIHHHYGWHKYFLDSFSHTLIAQKDYIQKLFEEKGNNIAVSWFPLWATQNVEPVTEKNIPVSFRGTLSEELHPGRKIFLDDLSKNIPLDYGEGPYPEVYSRSKIVINEAVKGDVNFRVFESMISGALLITPKVGNGLEDLFIDGEEVVFYEENNVEDASAKITYYLKHEEERIRIANNGRKKVFSGHSLIERAKELDFYLRKIKPVDPNSVLDNSLIISAHKLKNLWVFLRKHKMEGATEVIDRVLNYIESACANMPIMSEISQNIETQLFAIDAINSDLMDDDSYRYWLSILEKKFSNSKVVDYILTSYKQTHAEFDNSSFIKNLKKERSAFLNELIK